MSSFLSRVVERVSGPRPPIWNVGDDANTHEFEPIPALDRAEARTAYRRSGRVFAAATTFSAASVSPLAVMILRPDSSRIFIPCSTFVPFEADDERDLEVDLVVGGQQGGGDDVALHDAAEDVDEDRLDLVRGQENSEGFEDLILVRTAADVEEVGRLSAVVLDHVHGRHGQASAVDEAGDVAVELDVGEAISPARISFSSSSAGSIRASELGVAVGGVVVEVQLAVEREDLAGVGDDQRVDLGERAVWC